MAKETKTKIKTRKVLDVTNKTTGEVTRMTYQKFYSHFGYGDRNARYFKHVQDILRGRHETFNAVEVEEVVPVIDKVALKAAIFQTPIALAVEPLRQLAIERAEEAAHKMIERATAELEAAGNDLKVVAPYPSSNLSTAEYRKQLAKYQFFVSITTSRDPIAASMTRYSTNLIDISPELVERFIQRSRENASFEYEAFVTKLVAKVGEVKTAKLEGDSVWQYSYLTVTKQDGSKECWKTQMILNQSIYGKLFNQFPTRKMKAAK